MTYKPSCWNSVVAFASKRDRSESPSATSTTTSISSGGLDQQLFVSRYLVALPKPNEIQQLIERDRAFWDQHGGRNRPQTHAPSKW